MKCEFHNCEQWRGIHLYGNNEGCFYLCSKHAKRANSKYIRKKYQLWELRLIK